MTTLIGITVEGTPVGWQRTTFGRNHGKPITQEKTRAWQGACRQLANIAMRGREPSLSPIRLRLVAWMPIPASWPIWKGAAALDNLIRPTVKPDLDNVVKNATDACNGVVFKDDAQVCELDCRAWYVDPYRARVDIHFMELPEAPAQFNRKADFLAHQERAAA